MRKSFFWTAAILLAISASVIAYLSLERHAGFEGEVYVDLGRGSSTVEIGRALARAGIIRFPWQFWLERALHPSAKIQAGEYRFTNPATVAEVFDRLARGDVFYFEFTVPEGSNMFDIANEIESTGVMSGADFLHAASDPKLIQDLAPSAPTLEGFLFPSTYRLTHSTTPLDLCRMMTDQFRKQWKKILAGSTADPQRTITLASLVEKETGVPEERPLIAGVFENRLKKGMMLQCDPTTIYAALLENRYRNAIHRSDLASRNDYNTYQHAGLPPGPIANPGADAIQAALHPAETEYLFFVAKPGGGGHQFSTTLGAHENAVQRYRKKPRKTK
jgi:UPF0755 protein